MQPSKRIVLVLCRDMVEPGNHHSQQTDTRTENQTPHVLTHRRVLNNENTWTQGGEHHTLGFIVGGYRRDSGREGGGGIMWGEMPDIGDREEGSKSRCHVYTYATILHVLHMYPKT